MQLGCLRGLWVLLLCAGAHTARLRVGLRPSIVTACACSQVPCRRGFSEPPQHSLQRSVSI